MNEELWEEIVAGLMPRVALFSSTENELLVKQLMSYNRAHTYEQHVVFSDQAEIIPKLAALLGRPFDDTVYSHVEGMFFAVKASLRDILAYQYKRYYSDRVYFWNPAEGFLIEDYSEKQRTIALAPQRSDPYEYFELKKDSFGSGFFSSESSFSLYLKYFGITLVNYLEANEKRAARKKITPVTMWGRVDWEVIGEKVSLGTDHTKIMSTLTRLIGRGFSTDVYVEWIDMDLPLLQGNMERLLENYRELIAPSLETIIFNLEVPYLIEIDMFGAITLGMPKGGKK